MSYGATDIEDHDVRKTTVATETAQALLELSGKRSPLINLQITVWPGSVEGNSSGLLSAFYIENAPTTDALPTDGQDALQDGSGPRLNSLTSDPLIVTVVGERKGGAATLELTSSLDQQSDGQLLGPQTFAEPGTGLNIQDALVAIGEGVLVSAGAFAVSVSEASDLSPVTASSTAAAMAAEDPPPPTMPDSMWWVSAGMLKQAGFSRQTSVTLTSLPDAEGIELGPITEMAAAWDTRFLWSGIAGSDASMFALRGQTLVLLQSPRMGQAPDATYTAQVSTVDDRGVASEILITVRILLANSAPTDILLTGGTVAENAAAGTVVGTLATLDPDAGDSVSYAIQGGSTQFAIVGNQIQVKAGALIDFEATPTVALTLVATDAAGLAVSKAVTVSLTNVNETPTDILLTGGTVAENAAAGTVVGTLATLDPDAGDSVSYAIQGGSTQFAVVGNQIQVKAGALIDFEATPTVALTLVATDAAGLAVSKAVTVSLTNVNETPTDILLTGGTVAENAAAGTVVGTLATLDPDAGDSVSYAIQGGSTQFAIVGNQIQVKAGALIDFEATPTVALTLVATDAAGLAVSKAVTVSLTNVNETPTDILLTGGTVAENAAAGTVVGTLATLDPDAGDSVSYAIQGGSTQFAIVGNQIQVKAGALIDFEATPTVALTLVATDAAGLAVSKAVTVSLTNVNETPTDILLTGGTVAENAAAGTVVGTLATLDPDAGDSVSYAIQGGSTQFTIVGNQIQVKAGALIDFEATPTVALTLVATDAAGLAVSKAVTVSLTNVNETPTDILLTGGTVAENAAAGTVVGTLATLDPDAGDSVSYAIQGGSTQFAIVGNQIQVKAGALIDFEATPTVALTLVATDAAGLAVSKAVTVSLTNVNETPTDILLTGGTVAENAAAGTVVGTLATLDPDAGDSVSYAIQGGSTQFAIVGNQIQVKAGALIDFEATPTVALTLVATDAAGLAVSKAVTVSLTNVNETPTDILLTGGTVAENAAAGTVVGTLATLDPDAGDSVSYAIQGGSTQFAIVGNQIQVKAGALIDFEATPTVALTLVATDAAGLAVSKAVTVSLTNVNETPTDILLTGGTVAENAAAGTVVGTLATLDPDAGDSVSYAIQGGSTQFAIVGNQIQVKAGALIDFEATPTVALTLVATDAAGLAVSKAVTVSLTNVNETPTDILLTGGTVAENAAAGTVVGTLATLDPDAGDSVSYAIQGGSTQFAIVGNQIQVKAGALIDFEATPTVALTLVATDAAGLAVSKAVTVSLTNVNETPTDILLTGGTVAENAAAGTVVGTLATLDPDAGDSVSYAIQGGSTQFAIVGNQIQVKAGALIDFEATPTVALTLVATDAAGLAVSKAVTVSLTNVNETPTDILLTGGTVAENAAAGTVVGTLATLDPDAGDSVSYAIQGGSTQFAIVGNQIQVKAGALIDFEATPTVALTLVATDAAGLAVSKAVTVSLTNVNETPTDILLTGGTVAENAAAGTVVGTLATLDPDAGDSVSYAIQGGSTQFAIVGNQIQVKAGALIDFEATPTVALTLVATDAAGLAVSKAVTVSLTNVNETPTDILLTGGTVAENAAAGTVVGTLATLDPDAGDSVSYAIQGGSTQFAIVGNQIQVKAGALIDFEATPTVALTLVATDAAGLAVSKAVTVSLTNVNETPTDILLTGGTVAENAAAGTVVGTLATLDPDAGDSVSYAIQGGSTQFAIVGNQIQVKAGALIDFEATPTVALTLVATDAAGLAVSKAVTVSLTNVNETPTDILLTGGTVAENAAAGTVVGTLATLDPDAGDSVSYAIQGGSTQFAIVGNQIQVKAGALIDFEATPTVALTLVATDAAGLAVSKAVTVSLTNVNETPTDILLTGGTVAENAAAGTVVGTLATLDPDAGDSVSYAIQGGSTQFAIVGNQIQVKAGALIDFEATPTVALTLVATDAAGLAVSKAVTVSLTNVNETPTDILLTGGTVAENAAAGTVVGTLATLDPDAGDSVSYAIQGGSTQFAIVGNQIQVKAGALIDFEATPTVALTLVATDAAGLAVSKAVTVSLTNVNETPTDILLTGGTVAENAAAGTVVGTLATLDPDAGDSVSYAIQGGSTQFAIVGNQIQVKAGALIDFEATPTVALTLVATDAAGLAVSKAVTVSLTNVNETPTDILLTGGTVAENAAAGTVVGTLATLDPDAGDSVSYAIQGGSTQFAIVGNQIQVKAGALIDFEATPTVALTLVATDAAGLAVSKAVTVSLTNVNETPTDILLTGGTVAENAAAGTVVGTLATLDPDAGDSVSYAIQGGSTQFAIVGNQIQVKAGALIDFEATPTVALTLVATDAAGLAVSKAVTVSLTNVNETPTDILLTGGTVAENAAAGTVVGTLATLDPDAGDSVSYAIQGGSTQFAIVGNQIQVKAGALIDFEATPTVALTLVATDAAGLAVSKAVTVSLTNVNETPTDILLTGGTVAENAAAGTVVGTLATLDPDAGDSVSYAIQGGSTQFAIVGNQIQVKAGALIDFEATPTVALTLVATDAAGLAVSKAVTVSLTNVNETPTDILLTGGTVAENAAAGTVVGTLATLDPDAGDSVSYAIQGGSTQFAIVGNQIQVKAGALIDFEATPTVALTLVATDAAGLAVSKAVTVSLTNVNETPTDILLTGGTVAENAAAGTVVGTLATLDPDAGDSVSYAIQGGSTQFAIVGNQIQVKAGALIDFEATPTVALTLVATDAAGLAVSKAVTVSLTNVNETPTDILLTGGTVAENAAAGTVVGTLATLDPDAGDSVSYAIQGGSTQFAIVGNQIQVKAGALIDFEATPTVALTLVATDAAGLAVSKAVTVSLTNVNETPTDILLTGGTVAENAAAGTVVGTLATLDPDAGDSVSYAIQGGSTQFAIVGNQIQVKAGALIDFEATPTVALTLVATDAAGLAVSKAVTVSLTNVNETPTDILLTGGTVAENAAAGTVVGTLATLDPDAGDSFTYSLANASSQFAIVGNQIQVKAGATIDFEATPSVSLAVRATDAGGLSVTRTVTLSLTGVNEAPTDITLTGGTIAENAAAGSVVGTLAAVDPDAGDTFTYSLVNASSQFQIVNNQIQVKTGATIDFEATPSVSLAVRATDAGGLSTTKTITLSLTNVNETPTDITLTGGTIAENAAANSVVGTLAAVDPDAGDTFTYSLVNASSQFQIVNNQIQVKAGATIDFEATPSVNLAVRATDAGGLSVTRTVTLSLTNVNETPTDITLTGGTIAENPAAGSVVGTLTAVDPDAGDTFTYSLVNASSQFQIVNNQIQVKAGATIDFEATPSVSLAVRATDAGGLSTTKTITLSLTNVNETPTDITLTGNTIAENAAAGSVIGTLGTTDPDAGDTFTYSLVNASSQFQIVGNQLQVKAGAIVDFETTPSLSVVVRSTDAGGLSTTKTLTVNLTDIAEAPTDIVLAGFTTLNGLNAVYNATYDKYYAAVTVPLNWEVAMDFAQASLLNGVSGTLVTVGSSAENTFVSGLVGNQTYMMGGSDKNVEGTWRWYQGDTPWAQFSNGGAAVGGSYVNWTSGQPDNSGGNQDYLAGSWSGLQWDDTWPTQTYRSVIQWSGDAVRAMAATQNGGVTASVVSGAAANTLVGTLSATDQDGGSSFTYTIIGGSAASKLVITNGNQLRVAQNAVFNDSIAPSETVILQSTDNTGLTRTETMTISVVNLPVNLTWTGSNLLQNGSFGTGLNTPNFAWRGVDGGNLATVGSLQLDGFTGTVESASQVVRTVAGSQYTLSFQYSGSAAGLSSNVIQVLWNGSVIGTVQGLQSWQTQTFTVTGTGGEDVLTFSETAGSSDGSGSFVTNVSLIGNQLALAENAVAGTLVGTVSPSYANGSIGVPSYALSGIGASNFAINSAGQITVAAGASLDYETQSLYQLSVTITDGNTGLNYTKPITISLLDVSGLYEATAAVTTSPALSFTPLVSALASTEQAMLVGYAGDDILIGNAGNDTIYGGTGKDYMDGRAGNDLITSGGSSPVIIDGGTGTDTVSLAARTAGMIMSASSVGLQSRFIFDNTVGGAVLSVAGNQSAASMLLVGASTVVNGDVDLRIDSGNYGIVSGLQIGGSAFTISIDVTLDRGANSGNSGERIIDFGSGAGNNNIYIARNGSTDELAFTILNGSNTIGSVFSGFGSLVAGKKTNVTATFDNGLMTLYLDGVSKGSYNTGTTSIPNIVRANNYIGRSNWAGDAATVGTFDNLSIWNRALSGSEVAIAAPVTTGVYTDLSATGLQGRYTFDNLVGGVVAPTVGGSQPWSAQLQSGANTTTNGDADLRLTGGSFATIPGLTIGGSAFSISLEATLDRGAGAATWERIIDFGNGPGVDNITIGRNFATNDLLFSIRNGSTTIGSVIAPGVIVAGQKMNITATFDNGVMSLYVDGALKGTLNTGVTSILNGVRANNYIGKSSFASDATTSGTFDNISIWNRALGATEIATGTIFNVENATGTAYADTLIGAASGSVLNGGAGADILIGGAGADTIDGGTGLDYIDAGGGNDVISKGGTLPMIVEGGAGTDRIDLSSRTTAGGAMIDLSNTGLQTRFTFENVSGTSVASVGGAQAITATLVNGAVAVTSGDTDISLSGGPTATAPYVDLGPVQIGGAAFSFSIEATFSRAANNSNTFERVVEFGDVGGTNQVTLARVGTTDQLFFEVITNGVSSGYAQTPAGTIVAGQKMNLTATFDNGVLSLYVNGSLSASVTASFSSIPEKAYLNNRIGKSNYAADQSTVGSFDNLTTWNRALSAAEVATGQAFNVENATGTANNDTMTGATGGSLLDAGAGNDLVRGLDAADTILAGAGDDTVHAGGGADSVDGGDGNDLITGDNLLINGDFEATPGGTMAWSGWNNFWLPASVTGWSVVSGNVDINDAMIILPTGPAGRVIDMAGTTNGTMSQTVGSLVAGASYTLSLDTLQRDSTPDGSVLQIVWNGATVATLTTTWTSWQTSTFTLTAVSGNNTLMLREVGAGNASIGTTLDNVSLKAAGSTDGADYLTGGTGNDLIAGDGGNDTLVGGAGDDTLSGGTGIDVAVYTGSVLDYSWGLDRASRVGVNDTRSGSPDGNDILVNIEQLQFSDGTVSLVSAPGIWTNATLTGTSGRDVLIGSAGSDNLSGGAGNDTLFGNGGQDTLDGGVGSDLVDFAWVSNGIAVDLNNAAAQSLGNGSTVILSNIENVRGTGYNDTLTAAATGSLVMAGAGNDSVVGGAGIDSINGDAGNDLLYGNDGNDVIDGGAGNDLIYGGNGDDALTGGLGADTIYGEAGNDVFSFSGPEAGVIDRFFGGSGTDTILFGSTAGSPFGVNAPTGWTLALTTGSILSTGPNLLTLTSGAVGTVTFSNGASLQFDDVERLTWTG